MAMTGQLLDEVIFDVVNESEAQVEALLGCDLLYYFGELRTFHIAYVRSAVEKMAARADKRDVIGICLTTPGGQAEAVEKMVEIVRYHYNQVYFIVTREAMSAGTIFCMSGDRIFMDY